MSTVKELYRNLYEDKDDNADVTFLVHGEELKAHKIIVSGRSEMLKAMLNFPAPPVDPRYPVNDEVIQANDFKQFLKFLYLDECDVNYTNIGALLHISEMYLVPLLKAKCLEFVKEQCNTINGILQCCEIGILHENECPEMIRICLGAFSKLTYDIIPNMSFTYTTSIGKNRASAELIERIAKDCSRTYCWTEDVLLEKIFDWAQMKCKRPVTPEGMQNILAEIMKYINLEYLSSSWLNTVRDSGLISSETYNNIKKNCGSRSARFGYSRGGAPPRGYFRETRAAAFGGYRVLPARQYDGFY